MSAVLDLPQKGGIFSELSPGGGGVGGGGRGSYGGYGETQCGYVLGEFVQGGGKDLVGELC